MAAPPDGLSAHDRAPLLSAELEQPRKPRSPGFSHRVVRIVVKALVRPEGVHVRRYAGRLAAKPAEGGKVLVADPHGRQRARQSFAAALRVPGRSRNGADIDDEPDLCAVQQLDDLSHRAGRMADGEERVRRPPLDHRRMRVSTPALWKATCSVLSLLIAYCGWSLLA